MLVFASKHGGLDELIGGVRSRGSVGVGPHPCPLLIQALHATQVDGFFDFFHLALSLMLFRVWQGVDQFYAKIAGKKFTHLSLKLLNNQQRADSCET